MENKQALPTEVSEQITAVEVKLVPVNECKGTDSAVFRGPPPTRLYYDRWCECGTRYRNEIFVPKRHSVICLCPRCGCVTVD